MAPPEGGEPYFVPPFRRSRVSLSVHDGGDVVARATLERDLVPPSVGFRELTFEADGIAGLVFAPERPRGAAVVVLGGGELALLAASLDPTLVDRVVALVPSSRVGFADVSGRRPAWTWTGEPLEPRTPIEVERIRGPVLAVGAGQDTVWFSKAYVNEIEKRGGARVAPLHYEDAGHAVGGPLPYLPSRPTNLTGGTPEADEEARRDLWPRILDFLR
jgi:dienelactone hydrolase